MSAGTSRPTGPTGPTGPCRPRRRGGPPDLGGRRRPSGPWLSHRRLSASEALVRPSARNHPRGPQARGRGYPTGPCRPQRPLAVPRPTCPEAVVRLGPEAPQALVGLGGPPDLGGRRPRPAPSHRPLAAAIPQALVGLGGPWPSLGPQALGRERRHASAHRPTPSQRPHAHRRGGPPDLGGRRRPSGPWLSHRRLSASEALVRPSAHRPLSARLGPRHPRGPTGRCRPRRPVASAIPQALVGLGGPCPSLGPPRPEPSHRRGGARHPRGRCPARPRGPRHPTGPPDLGGRRRLTGACRPRRPWER